MRILTLLLVLVCSAGLAETNPELDKANRLLNDQKYPEAARALEAAAKVVGNSREVTLRIYELQGIAYGQLGQAAKAHEAFSSMLSIDPKRELNGKYGAKVLAAFTSAKEWAENNPAMEFKAQKAAVDASKRVMQLAAKVKNDGMKQARKVRFHLRPDDARWSEQDSELQGAYAAANTDAAGVEWWAELLGDNDRVLALVGTESDPIREGTAKDKPAEVAVADAPKKEEPKVAEKETKPADEPAPVEDTNANDNSVTAQASSGGSPLRPVGVVMMAVGAVGLGIGAYFGIQVTSARGQISGAHVNSSGVIDDPVVTQKVAFALDKQASSDALVANVLFGVGGALAVGGGICWLVGGSSSSSGSVSVAVSPVPGGVLVHGGF